MRNVLRRAVVFATLATATNLVVAAPAAADGGITYRPPVDAPVADPFRAPANPYGPGNRGIEYATPSGDDVRAVADGTVAFAGVVAGKRWITLRHADGVRTTYGPMADMAVAVGQPVRGGDVIGTTAGALLLTARIDDAYVDPASLFNGPWRVHLVPEPLDAWRQRLASRSWAERGLDALSSAVQWELDRAVSAPDLAVELTAVPILVDTVEGMLEWNRRRDDCTPATAVASAPPGRRVVVLVGGLGSTSDNAAVADVDTAGLGYAPGDVARFSYAGGRVPAGVVGPSFADVGARPYDARDTVVDLEGSAQRLAEMLRTVARATPSGVPVDVLAHSQGGLVTRAALGVLAESDPDLIARLGAVVTLGTPHEGADLAALVRAADGNVADRPLLDLVDQAADLSVHPDDPAVAQLAPGSPFLVDLALTPLPPGPRYVSVAARSDVVVPSSRAHWADAANVVVSVDGLGAHDRLPGSPAAAREIALALSGRPPTCESLAGALLDTAEGSVIHHFERALTLTQGGG